ncbi:MAG: D-tyrosyl-tRNA(Tyr) deacylase [Dehalococcoidia bacterium]|nr:D-tyrosyl-tRNA(Tyr) deacylase [Dehalococcoidia bacterium]
MKLVLQRVSRAAVSIGGEVTASVQRGLVVLLGVQEGDSEADAIYLAEKVAHVRIFSDSSGKFSLSVKDIGGEVMVVSQFTLLADARKGRRPNFVAAAPPAVAEPLVMRFIDQIASLGVPVTSGRFGASMSVELINDGPVTIILDSRVR